MTIFFWRVFLSSRFLDLETILSILSNKIIRLALLCGVRPIRTRSSQSCSRSRSWGT